MIEGAIGSRNPPQGTVGTARVEKRQITVLICDLVGSTELTREYNAEEFWRIIQRYIARCREAAARNQGVVGRDTGDGLEVYFGYPRATEQAADLAIRTGLDILEGVGQDNENGDEALSVRIGIATGQVVIGAVTDDFDASNIRAFGPAPSLAARLQGAADANSILVDQQTMALAVETEFTGPTAYELKGIAEPVDAWKVVSAGAGETRLSTENLSSLVGREDEINSLLRQWETALTGAGQVALVTGQPGIGKSRLAHELAGHVLDQGSQVLRFQCSACFASSPLHPLLRQLERAAKLESGDSDMDRLKKLSGLFHFEQSRLEQVMPILARYLAISKEKRYPPLVATPELQRELARDALTDQIVEVAARKPLLIVVEDAHWIDPTSQAVFDAVIEATVHLPVLFLVTSRLRSERGWRLPARASRLLARPLGPDHVQTLIQTVGRKTVFPSSLVQWIVCRCEGIPFYVEEMTRMWRERPMQDLHLGIAPCIPSSLQGLIYERLDQLEGASDLAEIAATIDHEFELPLLQSLSGWPMQTLRLELGKLLAADLLQPYQHGTKTAFAFKHALLRDAVYDRLITERKQELHERIARRMESDPRQVEAHPELIARHFTLAAVTAAEMGRADKQISLCERAVDGWVRAGQAAFDTGATQEAVERLTEGLTALQALPKGKRTDGRELSLRQALAKALSYSYGWADESTRHACGRAVELSWELRDLDAHIVALDFMFGGQFNAIDLDSARETARRMIDVGERCSHPMALATGHQDLGMGLFVQGEYQLARFHLESALKQIDRIRTGVNGFPWMVYAYLAVTLYVLGHRTQAEALVADAIDRVLRVEQNPYNVAAMLGNGCYTYQLSGDLEHVSKLANLLVEHAGPKGYVAWTDMGNFFAMWVALQHRSDARCLQRFEAALEGMASEEVEMSYFFGVAARSYLEQGEHAKAEHYLERALRQAEDRGERFFLAELYRLKSRHVLTTDPGATRAAETWLRRSIECARSQQAATFEARAVDELAELLRDTGRIEESENVLASSISSFAAGNHPH